MSPSAPASSLLCAPVGVSSWTSSTSSLVLWCWSLGRREAFDWGPGLWVADHDWGQKDGRQPRSSWVSDVSAGNPGLFWVSNAGWHQGHLEVVVSAWTLAFSRWAVSAKQCWHTFQLFLGTGTGEQECGDWSWWIGWGRPCDILKVRTWICMVRA